MNFINNKTRGCLIGGAIGDALGYPVEFVYSHRKIIEQYGKSGITDYDMDYPWLSSKPDKAQVSDDTQMTLYTAEAILADSQSEKTMPDNIKKAYIIWMCGQTGEDPIQIIDLKVSRIKELNQRRAPGNTCISSLYLLNQGENAANDSKGCGGIMRISPVAILGAVKGWNIKRTMKLAGEASEITHGHPLSTYSSEICAGIIQKCLKETHMDTERFRQIINEVINEETEIYGDNDSYIHKLKTLICKSLNLINDPREDWEIIELELGEGWVAEETLAIALFCVARHINDFKECIVSSVNHGGDSDSTGAVAGNIIGAILGYDAIPEQYLKNLQNLDFMLEVADKLSEL